MTSNQSEHAPGSTLWRVIRVLAVLIVCVAVIPLLVVVAARMFGWQSGPLYYLVALTPYVGLALLVLAGLAAALRAWWLVAVALVPALLVGWWWRPVLDAAGSPQWGLTVMSVNLQFGRADPAAVVTAVRERSVSVLSVQEVTRASVAGLTAAGLDQELPYRMVRTAGASPASGTGIWSRYPLSDRSETDRLVFQNLVATVTVGPGVEFSFFAMHPIPPTPIDGDRGSEIAAATRQFMNERPGPAVAAGDFNSTRDNVPIRALQSDGWQVAGGVWPAAIRTWPNDLRPLPPLIAIDHILTRGAPPGREVTVIDIPGTDHRAVVATL